MNIKLPELETWPIRFLLASDNPDAMEIILRRYIKVEHPPESKKRTNPILRGIITRNQAGICLYRLSKCPVFTEQCMGESAETQLLISVFKSRLEKHRLKEMAKVANRKLAMQELDKRAGEMGIKPIILKGAATAIQYYPEESMRGSGDIDILLEKSDLKEFIPSDAGYSDKRHDAGQYSLFNFGVEAHQFVGSNMKWGLYEDLISQCGKTDSYNNLQFPDEVDALFIALRHYTIHAAEMPWDLLDCSLILTQKPHVLKGLIERFLHDRTMTMLVLPPLVILAELGVIDKSTLERIYDKLSSKDQKLLQSVITHHFATEHSSFSNNYFSARIHNISWLKKGLSKVFLYKDMVKARSGYGYSHPMFWVHYLVIHPFWRLMGCINKKYNKTYQQ